MKPLALLGGTFDPVHIGHLNAAWEAADLLDAEVRLMVAAQPALRKPPVASAQVRAALLQAALAGQDKLHIDTRELQRNGMSYTVDTLAQLRTEQGDRPLIWLVGADAFTRLAQWHRWRELFTLAHLAVLRRPNAGQALPAEIEAEVHERWVDDARALAASPCGKLVRLEVTPLAISASRVRRLLAEGHVPRYLLPPGVLAHAELLRVYQQA